MEALHIKHNKCPFCQTDLKHQSVKCPDGRFMPLLVCYKCKSYFYKRFWYNELKLLAEKQNKNLSKNIFIYKEAVIPSDSIFKISQPTITKRKRRTTNQRTNKPYIKPSNKNIHMQISMKKSSPTVMPSEQVSTNKQTILKSELESCRFYNNGYCDYKNTKCHPFSITCKRNQYSTNKLNPVEPTKLKPQPLTTKNHINGQYTEAILLSYNRKCFNDNHILKDTDIMIRVVRPSGEIVGITIKAAFCKDCDCYIVLKRDFNNAKHIGVLLCSVEEIKVQASFKPSKTTSGNESKIHALGYNVMKKFDYTQKQREVILANIIENHGITQHEILSIIDLNITRHQSQANYSNAVSKWKHDRVYVSNYKYGDLPEVIIDKVKRSR